MAQLGGRTYLIREGRADFCWQLTSLCAAVDQARAVLLVEDRRMGELADYLGIGRYTKQATAIYEADPRWRAARDRYQEAVLREERAGSR